MGPAGCKPARANIPKDAHLSACFSMSKLALLQESNMLNCRRKSLQVALFIGQAAAKTVGPLNAKEIRVLQPQALHFTALRRCAGFARDLDARRSWQRLGFPQERQLPVDYGRADITLRYSPLFVDDEGTWRGRK